MRRGDGEGGRRGEWVGRKRKKEGRWERDGEGVRGKDRSRKGGGNGREMGREEGRKGGEG